MADQKDPRIADISNLLDSILGMTVDIDESDVEDAVHLLGRLEKKLLSNPELRSPLILDKCFMIVKNGEDPDVQRAAFSLLTSVSKESPVFAESFAAKFSDKTALEELGNRYAGSARDVWAALESMVLHPPNKAAARLVLNEFGNQLLDPQDDSDVKEDKVKIIGAIGSAHPELADTASALLIKMLDTDDHFMVLQAVLEALSDIGVAHPQKSLAYVDAISKKMAKKDFFERDFALDALAKMGAEDSTIASRVINEAAAFIKSRTEDEEHIVEKGVIVIAAMAQIHANVREDAIRALSNCFRDEKLSVGEASLRLVIHYGVADINNAKTALAELSGVIAGPQAITEFFRAEIAISGLIRIAMTYPAFAGRVVEIFGQAMATATPQMKNLMIEGIVRISQPDPARWKSGLCDTFRRAADAAKVPGDVIMECETRVADELNGGSPQTWDRIKAFESARRLDL